MREYRIVEIPLPQPIVAVREVLPYLGFVEDWNSFTDLQPGFKFKRGNLEVAANQGVSLYLRPEFSFGGLGLGPHSLQSIEFAMPLAVESFEQAVAWIVYGIGTSFVPSAPIRWFEEGKEWQHLLPWEGYYRDLLERAKQRRELRLARPHCFVARDWMRMLRKQLRVAADSAGEHDEFAAEFDGQMFKIALPDTTIGAPASGPASWGCYRGRIAALAGLPARFMTDTVEIGIWEGQLEIDWARFEVVADGSKMALGEHPNQDPRASAQAPPSDKFKEAS